MTALTRERAQTFGAMDVPRQKFTFPVAASVVIYPGALVVLDSSGNARPGRASTTDVAIGRAVQRADNSTGGAAAITVDVESGCFQWENLATDLVTAAQVGLPCFVEDDQTIRATSATSTRIQAGTVHIVMPTGKVFVRMGATA